ncbi:MAG TPA: hypothetical protein VGJ13_05280 [Pseudonocardiaceae bacterium]|jgi:phage gpG-like protein
MPMQGGAEFNAALAGRIAAARAVTDLAVKAAAEQVARDTVDKLMLKEHARRTPTPSSPGEPPAMITGALKSSVTVTPVTHVGLDRFEAKVGPTKVYARIQELGGTAGRGARLPARPYLKPAFQEARHKVGAIFRAMWATIR